ncbi:HyaD/HybD family hydrogenase maturation endopeptidase [Helicobacter sp. T3_23-1056]
MRVLVLGIGNILFGDEGIGVHLMNYLKLNYKFTHPLNSSPLDSAPTKSSTQKTSLPKSNLPKTSLPKSNELDSSENPKHSLEKYSLEFIDGGTLAQALIPLIVEYDFVLILDTVDVRGGKIGDVYSFPFDALPKQVSWAGSAHEVEMLQTLRLTQIMGDLPKIHIVGIIPEIIGEDTTFALSSELLSKVHTMEKEAIKQLESLGFVATKIDSPLSLQDIADKSYKGFD